MQCTDDLGFVRRVYSTVDSRTIRTLISIFLNFLLQTVYISWYIRTMSTDIPTKINQLLNSQPPGVVFQSRWLTQQGYSLDLQRKYRGGKWLKSIGSGAMIRIGDNVGYEGAIYSLQKQTKMSMHPGGRTALSLLGKAHYLEFEPQKIILFGTKGEVLPSWFKKHDWGVKVEYHSTMFLPPDLGLTEVDLKTFSLHISGAARALMECLYLAPQKQDLMEGYELMEGLNGLRPDQVQLLLEKSTSVKVNRLFLYLAEKAGHGWFNQVKTERVNLGSGKRSIVKHGVYVDKYQITVPKELEEREAGV